MLCGFAAPSLKRFLSFRLPAIPLKPPIPPPFKVPVAFSCPLNNPLRVGSTLPKGGGRVGYLPHDPDDDYDNVGSDTAPTP
jgi:hypothetical protein